MKKTLLYEFKKSKKSSWESQPRLRKAIDGEFKVGVNFCTIDSFNGMATILKLHGFADNGDPFFEFIDGYDCFSYAGKLIPFSSSSDWYILSE